MALQVLGCDADVSPRPAGIPGFKLPRLPEGFKLATLPETLKQEFKRIAEVARQRQEQELEQEIARERQERIEREQLERAKQRPLGGRPEKLTEEMGQAACVELEDWTNARRRTHLHR
jgi:hypothetical protein